MSPIFIKLASFFVRIKAISLLVLVSATTVSAQQSVDNEKAPKVESVEVAKDSEDSPKETAKDAEERKKKEEKKARELEKKKERDKEIAIAKAKAKQAEEDPLSFDRNINGLLGRYCYKCHNGDKANGDVNLAKDSNPRLILENAIVWESALSRVEAHEMPPEESKQQPSDKDRELIVAFLKKTLGQLNCETQNDPGKPGARRLNRVEYDNSIRFLTGLDLNLADSFPADASSYGFDNIAASLTLTPLQVEQYYQAAQKVVAALVQDKSRVDKSDKPIGYRKVYFRTVRPGDSEEEIAREVITRFANRAFRRLVDKEWIDRVMAIYHRSREEQLDHDASIGNMIVSVLISPRFLVRIEQDRVDIEEAYPVDAFDLASRLSFFLWSGPPDEALFKLAMNGEILKEEVIEQQVSRMLKDPQSDALISNFFAAWLQFNNLESRSPDKKVFASYDDRLHKAIIQEPRMLLQEIIRKDRPVTDLLDANYTYLNEVLAQHYGIEGVAGDTMTRVELTDRRRGGLLTSAALLMAQSDPSRTNVPRRGNFIAGAVLGSPAPPPPPDVPELQEPDPNDKPMTLRERLAAHSTNAQCASCHAKMDPLGFGFENYDAIGAWRESEVGKAIDSSGKLPNGTTFSGPVELKDILLDRKDEFAKTLATQMMIYALGRGPFASDKCVIEDAVEEAKANDYKFSAFVRAIVLSYPFLNRKNPEF